ncbi:MAG: phosphotransferase [Bacteroidales bacterium]|nr:phosphotransferase [Bacteroidales bacterium]
MSQSNLILTDTTLTVVLQERIDTLTTAELDKTLEEALGQLASRNLVLDACRLEYISSMGLRSLFSLRKKVPYRLVNVSGSVYDVLTTVGFDTVIEIEKAMRVIDLEGCQVIGHGINGTVYRLSDDLIAKIYAENIPLDLINQERKFAQAAFLSGLPTAISYDTVKSGNKYGIVFELLDAKPFADKIHGKPENFAHYSEVYAQTLKQIHSTEADVTVLPSAAEKYHGWVDQLAHLYTDYEREQMHKMINSLPERHTTIHGDYHTKNILMQGEQMLLIDMADVSYGHPMFDFACTAMTNKFYPTTMPETTYTFMGADAPEMLRLWRSLLEKYFDTTDEARIREIDEYMTRFALLRYALQPAPIPQLEPEMVQKIVADAREQLFPYIDEVVGKNFF